MGHSPGKKKGKKSSTEAARSAWYILLSRLLIAVIEASWKEKEGNSSTSKAHVYMCIDICTRMREGKEVKFLFFCLSGSHGTVSSTATTFLGGEKKRAHTCLACLA